MRWGHLNPIKYHDPGPPSSPTGFAMACGNTVLTSNIPPRAGAGATTIESIRARDGELMAEKGTTGIVVGRCLAHDLVGGGLEA